MGLMAAFAVRAETLNQQICMAQVWEESGNHQEVQCTAEDISISLLEVRRILDDGCGFVGDTVAMKVGLTVLQSADTRWDIGLWLSEDGASALYGSCTVATLPLDLDLDGTTNDPGGMIQDTCGDMFQGSTEIEVDLVATCADNNGDGYMDLVYCSSWRQEDNNGLCTGPLDAFPGAPSKCNCALVNVPILIGLLENVFESGFETE